MQQEDEDLAPTATVEGPGGLWRSPAEAVPVARGSSVGRYLILDVLGAGGMGVVYAGYDPELDRKVALKLLRPERTAQGEPARRRLQQEAQAAARLSHPNVVTVYDVGVLGDQVFIAMELVAGRTLRQWMAAGPCSWREALDVYLAAGRGLAAAHAAGLVHRDFKPENVLLGDDGRARVADFGVALPDGDGAEDPARWGTLVGTLAYMSPEQLRGARADARSDQWSFCAGLYEAVYGQPPYPGGLAERRQAFEEGRGPEPQVSGKRVPGRLRRTLLRGLSLAPGDRFPTLDALLAELGADRSAASRRWAVAAVLAAGIGAAVFAAVQHRNRLCSGGEARLAGIWDAPRKAAIHRVFLASRLPFAAQAWQGVERELDRYTAGWTRQHRDACEATRLRGEQSEDLLDRRMFCLDERLGEVRALSDLFARADSQVIEKARDAVAQLPLLDLCADRGALLARVPPPRDPDQRSRVQAVQARLAAADALGRAGKEKEALERLRPLAVPARRTGYRPAEAAVLYRLGLLGNRLGRSAEAEEPTFQALLAAQAGGDLETAALAAAELSWIVGTQLTRPAEGERWSRMATALAEGARSSPEARAAAQLRLASLLDRQGRYREAVAVLEPAIRETEARLGAGARTAEMLCQLGICYNNLGRYPEAIAATRRSLAIRQRILPPEHPDLGRSEKILGTAYLGQRQLDPARAHLQRAVTVFTASYGALHPETLGTRGNLGIVSKELNRLDEALAQYRAVLAGFQALDGPGSYRVAIAWTQIGEALQYAERYPEALGAYRQALAIDRRLLGEDHPDLAYDYQGIGLALWALGRYPEAAPPLERALALREANPVSPALLAESRQYLARNLIRGGGDRERAYRLLLQAREGYRRMGNANNVKEVELWLPGGPQE